MADIDEHRGEGERDQKGFGTRQDRTHRRQVGRETGHKPDRKAPCIGDGSDQKGDQKEKWRVVPAVERHLAAAEHGFLGGMLARRLVGLRGPALPDQRAGGIDVGEIGADGLAVAIDQAVRQDDPADRRNRGYAEQDQAIAARARGGQPLAGSKSLPDMSHFAAEFYEYCATVTVPRLTFPKVWACRTNLLAMQRDAL